MNLYSGARTAAGRTFGVLLLLLMGYAAYPLIGVAHAAASPGSLIINAFSLPDGDTISVLVEIQSGSSLIKSGFAPLTIEGQAGTIYTIKVSNSQNYAFDHWQDGSKSNTKAVLFSKDVTLAAFFKKVSAPPNLTVSAVTPNGEELHMWTTVRSGIQTIDAGLTPFSFSGSPGKTYQLTVENQEAESASSHGEGNASLSRIAPISIVFNHWQDNNDRSRTRSITMPGDAASLNLVGVFNKGDRVTLEDLGVLQLVSHDLYNTIRDGPHPGSIEDERLNLSTLLDHGENQIIVGGEPRNSENIALHTVAVKLGKMYLDLIIDKKMSAEDARKETVQVYLKMVAKAYEDTFHEPFPDPAPSEHEAKDDGTENLTGDLSLRAVHSYVPGHIMVNGVDTPILDPSLRGKILSDGDMQQLSKPLDGTFDPVFRNVTIFLPPPNPPPNTFTIDLFERDSSFAKQFGTDVSFEEFMNELKDGRFDENEKVMFYLREDVANGLMPLEEEERGQDGADGNATAAAQESIAGNATAVVANTTAVASASTEIGNTPTAALAAVHNGTEVVQEPQTARISNSEGPPARESSGDEQEIADDNGDQHGEKHWSANDEDRSEHDDDRNDGNNERDHRQDHQHDDDGQDRRSRHHDNEEDGSQWNRHQSSRDGVTSLVEKIIQ